MYKFIIHLNLIFSPYIVNAVKLLKWLNIKCLFNRILKNFKCFLLVMAVVNQNEGYNL